MNRTDEATGKERTPGVPHRTCRGFIQSGGGRGGGGGGGKLDLEDEVSGWLHLISELRLPRALVPPCQWELFPTAGKQATVQPIVPQCLHLRVNSFVKGILDNTQ